MAAYSSKTDVAKAALAEAGCRDIANLSSSGASQDHINLVYEPQVLSSLTTFGFGDSHLEEIVELAAPSPYDGDWMYSRPIPQPSGGVLSPRRVLISMGTGEDDQELARDEVDFIQRGDLILTNYNDTYPLFLVYTTRPDESVWAADMAEHIMLRIAAKCAQKLRRDAVLARELNGRAEKMEIEARARSANASNRKHRRPAMGRLNRAHTGNRRWRTRY